ncbi:NEDD8-activating enzyme E1 regulatory subunit [Blattella germanica]|nr:NEDD8-activating enzyme E1 regulatory subunit [Blattella germanica]
MSSPAPKSPEQSEKSKKYDRQLRLWGDHGQSALESAQVCLINATAVGTEILKSLVLPGIGAFTIVDGKKITEEDIGCNFFLDSDSYGKSRAEISTQLLLELNPDVRGDYVDENIDQLLENSPDFFNNFTVVIGTALSERSLISLSKKLWQLEIPFIVCRSYGFVGSIRIQIGEHTVIETHPDNQTPDLRLDKPFSSLRKFVDSINLESMEFKDHAHVPYLIILYKCIFVDEHGNPEAEENFEEAIRAVTTTITPTSVPPHIKEILEDQNCINLTSKVSWS